MSEEKLKSLWKEKLLQQYRRMKKKSLRRWDPWWNPFAIGAYNLFMFLEWLMITLDLDPRDKL